MGVANGILAPWNLETEGGEGGGGGVLWCMYLRMLGVLEDGI